MEAKMTLTTGIVPYKFYQVRGPNESFTSVAKKFKVHESAIERENAENIGPLEPKEMLFIKVS
jgi:hypothetical protein